MNETFRVLIDTFGKGWERGEVDAICSVFTEDAVFLETPFSSPDRGMAAIRAYWKDIPLYQAETDFSSGEIYAAGPRGCPRPCRSRPRDSRRRPGRTRRGRRRRSPPA